MVVCALLALAGAWHGSPSSEPLASGLLPAGGNHNREHPSMVVAVGRQVELAEDRANVRLDRLLGEPELLCPSVRQRWRNGVRSRPRVGGAGESAAMSSVVCTGLSLWEPAVAHHPTAY